MSRYSLQYKQCRMWGSKFIRLFHDTLYKTRRRGDNRVEFVGDRSIGYIIMVQNERSQWVRESRRGRIMDLQVRMLLLIMVALYKPTMQLTFRNKFAENRQPTVNYDTPSHNIRYKYEIKTFDVRVSYVMYTLLLHIHTHIHNTYTYILSFFIL